MYRISVDTGGTFTDVVVTDQNSNVYMAKALTTREQAYRAIAEGLTDIAKTIGCEVRQIIAEAEQINYGTTRSTNLVVTGRTAKTALLTTEGFPDILLLREGGKPDPFRPLEYRGPYVPRYLTAEIGGRILSDGSEAHALDEGSVLAAASNFLQDGVEAVAVCLLWSVANPSHELRIAEILERELPGVPYTLSHQVNPCVREYRRASSTAIDASLKPSMQRFFADLETDLEEAGFTGSLLISTSYGGGWEAKRIAERPVYSIGSGPSMAPVAALREFGIDSVAETSTVLVSDMGGTTYDISVIQDGKIERTSETWLGGKWIGDITGTRSIDVESLGAGGGSIVWVDAGGLLQVGPLSAGSEPGPACYGKGGTEPTVTDAALLLGYLDSSNFLGGRLKLSHDLAEVAFTSVAHRLNMSIEDAAQSAMQISVDNIVTAIRGKMVAKGIDARETTLVAGGGASGMNVGLVAAELDIKETILPKAAGAMSAYGALYSDVVCEFDAVTFTSTGEANFTFDNEQVRQVTAQAHDFFAGLENSVHAERSIEYYAQARYPMQAWELTIALGNKTGLSEMTAADVEETFHTEHERVFGVREDGEHVELLGIGARAAVHHEESDVFQEFVEDAAALISQPTRRGYFKEVGWLDMAVVTAGDLAKQGSIVGPAVVLENTTTIVVYPGQVLHACASGNYRLEH